MRRQAQSGLAGWARNASIPSIAVIGLAFAPLSGTAGAQTSAPGVSRNAASSRAALESLAVRREEDAHAKPDRKERAAMEAEASSIRDRLRNGDFRVGDRILLVVSGDSTLSDTVTVAPGPVLKIPPIPDIPLAGVLRAELQDYLTKQFAHYLKDPTVSATVLMRVAIIGEVGRPGFYNVPSDLLVSDAIMLAGGPSSLADVNKTVVKRASKQILSKKVVRSAIVSGTTLDELDLRPGDEIVVGKGRQWDWTTAARITAALITLTYAVTRVSGW